MEPSIQLWFHVKPYGRTYLATIAVRNVPITTPTVASRRHCQSVDLTRCHLSPMLSAKRSRGRKM